jgi:hypothetical protein
MCEECPREEIRVEVLGRFEGVVTTDGEVRYENVFRDRWRELQSAGARPGQLIKQPGWIDAGLAVLGALVVAGAFAAGTLTVAETDALPAVVHGTNVTATLTGGLAPAPGTAVQYRDASGTTLGGVVVEATATEVTVRLDRAGPASAGELLVPAGRQRLISVLLPRLS